MNTPLAFATLLTLHDGHAVCSTPVIHRFSCNANSPVGPGIAELSIKSNKLQSMARDTKLKGLEARLAKLSSLSLSPASTKSSREIVDIGWGIYKDLNESKNPLGKLILGRVYQLHGNSEFERSFGKSLSHVASSRVSQKPSGQLSGLPTGALVKLLGDGFFADDSYESLSLWAKSLSPAENEFSEAILRYALKKNLPWALHQKASLCIGVKDFDAAKASLQTAWEQGDLDAGARLASEFQVSGIDIDELGRKGSAIALLAKAKLIFGTDPKAALLLLNKAGASGSKEASHLAATLYANYRRWDLAIDLEPDPGKKLDLLMDGLDANSPLMLRFFEELRVGPIIEGGIGAPPNIVDRYHDLCSKALAYIDRMDQAQSNVKALQGLNKMGMLGFGGLRSSVEQRNEGRKLLMEASKFENGFSCYEAAMAIRESTEPSEWTEERLRLLSRASKLNYPPAMALLAQIKSASNANLAELEESIELAEGAIRYGVVFKRVCWTFNSNPWLLRADALLKGRGKKRNVERAIRELLEISQHGSQHFSPEAALLIYHYLNALRADKRLCDYFYSMARQSPCG